MSVLSDGKCGYKNYTFCPGTEKKSSWPSTLWTRDAGVLFGKPEVPACRTTNQHTPTPKKLLVGWLNDRKGPFCALLRTSTKLDTDVPWVMPDRFRGGAKQSDGRGVGGGNKFVDVP